MCGLVLVLLRNRDLILVVSELEVVDGVLFRIIAMVFMGVAVSLVGKIMG
jgi:hypothetical protein